MIREDTHLNYEKIIRYYLLFLPPRGCDSIIDIGCGITSTYKCMLKPRTKKYVGLDIRPGKDVDIVADICNMYKIEDKQFSWGWCTDVLEHIEPEKKLKAAKEIMRICKNCVFIYPLVTLHSEDKNVVINSFYDDPGHTEVKIDWIKEFQDNFYIEDKTTKTGRGIIILTSKDDGTWKEQKEKEEKYVPKKKKTKEKVRGFF